MANPPSMPNDPSGGTRQQKAAALRAEAEQPAKPEGAEQPQRSETSTEQGAVADAAAAGQTAEPEAASETGPVGEGDYIVHRGDCISSIAMEHGFAPDTIWNDPGNTKLRDVRKNPNVLLADDRVTIPELRRKEEPGETEMLHRFRLKGQPEMLRIRFLDEFQQPRQNIRYVLIVDGETSDGITNEDGELQEPISPNARRGKLTLYEGDDDEGEEMPLELGRIDPLTEISGVQGRLANLGFDCDLASGQLDARTRDAISQFQRQRGLEPTGEPDQGTRNELEKCYGS